MQKEMMNNDMKSEDATTGAKVRKWMSGVKNTMNKWRHTATSAGTNAAQNMAQNVAQHAAGHTARHAAQHIVRHTRRNTKKNATKRHDKTGATFLKMSVVLSNWMTPTGKMLIRRTCGAHFGTNEFRKHKEPG